MKLDPSFLEIAACPQCRGPLRESVPEVGTGTGRDAVPEAGTGTGAGAGAAAGEYEIICTSADCGLAYPVRDDIPVLLVDEARRPV